MLQRVNLSASKRNQPDDAFLSPCAARHRLHKEHCNSAGQNSKAAAKIFVPVECLTTCISYDSRCVRVADADEKNSLSSHSPTHPLPSTISPVFTGNNSNTQQAIEQAQAICSKPIGCSARESIIAWYVVSSTVCINSRAHAM